MTEEVSIERRVIEMSGSGLTGRDGVTGDYIRLTQTNESGNEITAEPVQNGAAYGILTTYGLPISYTTEGTSMSLEIAGVNAGDPRVIKHANSAVDVDPREFVPGDFIEVRGRPINPEDLGEGISYWEMVGPGVGLATPEEVAAETSSRVAVTPSNLPTFREAMVSQSLRTQFQGLNELVTATKPGRAEMMDDSRIIVTMRPYNADYRDGYERNYTDHVIYELRNLADVYHTVPPLSYPECWVLVSVWTVFEGVKVPQINYVWDRIVGGIAANNGQVPSAFDPIGFYGKQSEGVAAIMALNGSGPFHGHFDQLTFALTVTGGVKNGAIIPDGTDLQSTLKPGDVINFTQLDFAGTRRMNGPDGSKIIDTNDVWQFGGGQQCYANSIHSYVETPEVGVVVGYAFNNCFRNQNRLQGRGTDGNLVTPTCDEPTRISGQTALVGFQDGVIIDFPEVARITGWRTGDTASHCFESEMPATVRPARRNGVEIPYDNPGIVIDESSGPKYRQPIWVGSADFTVETGNEMNFACYYRGVRANGA